MILFASLIVAFGVAIFALTKIVDLLHAKKAEPQHVLLASLVGTFSALFIYFVLSVLMQGLAPLLWVVLIALSMFVTFAFSFKTINGMSWSAAFTTTVANIALVLLTSTIAIVLNKISLDSAIDTVHKTLKENTQLVTNFATGNETVMNNEDQLLESSELEEDIEPSFKEIDLLPAAAIQEIKENKKKAYRAPKYQVISLNSARSVVGKNIRIISKSGKTIKGALKSVVGNDVTVEQRTSNGIFIASIALSKIESLEVYR